MKEECPFCHKKIDIGSKFCPSCGNKIVDMNLPLSIGQKIKIYILSVILAPLGLYWFFKYFRNDSSDKKQVAFISLLITIVMIIILLVLNLYFIKTLRIYTQNYSLESFGY